MKLPSEIHRDLDFPALDANEMMTYVIRSGDGDGVSIQDTNDGTDHTFVLTQANSSMLPIGNLAVSRIIEDGTAAG